MTDLTPEIDPEAGEEDLVGDEPGGMSDNVSRSMSKILIGNVGMMALSVFTGVIVARTLLPEGRGEVAAVLSLVIFVALAGSIGSWTGLGRVEAVSPERSDQALGASLLGVAVLGTGAVLFAELILPLILRAQSAELVEMARWMVLLIYPVMLFDSANDLLVGRQRFGRVTADRTLRPLVHAIGIGALWFLDAVTVESVLLATGFSYLVIGVAAYWSLFKESGISRPDKALIKEASHFGTRVYGGILSQKSNHELDLIVMPALVGPEIIGIYVVAVSAAAIISGGFSHLRQLIFGIVSRDESGDNIEIIEFTGRLTFFAATFVAIILGVTAPYLVDLVYGSEFAGSVPVLRLLLPGVVLLVTAEVLFGALASMNKPLWATSASMIGLIGTVVGIAIFIRPFGAEGAAATSTVAYGMMFLAAVRYSRRLGIRPMKMFSIRLLAGDLAHLSDSLKRWRASEELVEAS